VLLPVALAPGEAWAGGRYHGGGRHHGHGHHGHHGHGGYWAPGLFFGGLALGAAITAPYWYGYPRYPYYAPGYYYGAPYYSAPPAVVYQQQAPTTYTAPAPVQREVVYPNGKYVLYGDGVTQAWQWVWVPNATAPPPPPTR
jgi:hypothetical protein